MTELQTKRPRLGCTWCGGLFREPDGWGKSVGEHVCKYCGHPIHALARNAWFYAASANDLDYDGEVRPTYVCEICHTRFGQHGDVYSGRNGDHTVETCPKCGIVAVGESGWDGL